MPRWRFLVDEDPGADQSTIDSTTWQNVHATDINHENPELTPDAKMWLMGIWLAGGNNVGVNTYQRRMQVEAATLADSTNRQEPRRTSQTSGSMYFMSRIFTLASSPTNDVRIQYRVSSAGSSAQANVAVTDAFYLFNLDELIEGHDYIFAETSTDLNDIVSGSWTSGQSITIPHDGDDWLIVTNCMCKMDNEVMTIRNDIFDGTTSRMESNYEQEDSNDLLAIGNMYAEANVDAGTVFTNRFRSDVSSTTKPDIQYNNIFALRLNAFEDHALVHDTTTTDLDVDDQLEVVQTLTHTTDHPFNAPKFWFAFAQGQYDIDKHQGQSVTRLHLAGVDIAHTLDRNMATNGVGDIQGCQTAGTFRIADNVDLDIDLVMKEITDVDPVGTVIESMICAFTANIKNKRGVRRVTEWEATYSNLDLDVRFDGPIPVPTPGTGPTGNVTIGTGPNRLFVFWFTAQDSPVTVSVFTIGGVTFTGSFENDNANGSGSAICNFWWWDEAAIQSMSGLAISWTDDQGFATDGADHSWATYIDVDQNDPVSETDESGTTSSSGETVNTVHVKDRDMVIIGCAQDLGGEDIRRCNGFAPIMQNNDGGVYGQALFEGKSGDQTATIDYSGDTPGSQLSAITLKAAPIRPFYDVRRDIQLRM